MKYFILTTVSFFYLNCNARMTDGKAKTSIENGILRINAIAGFHLNAEAPAQGTFDSSAEVIKPFAKTEKLFSFKIPPAAKVAHLSFYVCDDKKTACEQHRTDLDLKTAHSTASAEKPEIGGTKQKVNLVSDDSKPTLLVFSAPWCPACIRMQTETYHQPAVEKQLSQVHFLKLNSDLVENYDLSEKFHIKAIPTLILLNAQGEEVYRWLDFQPAKAFAVSLALETKKAHATESLLQLSKQGDLDAASKLGMREYNTLHCGEAVKWLSLSKKIEDQKFKLAAEVSCAQDKFDEDAKLKPAYLQTLEKGMLLTSSQWDQIRWFVLWMEKMKEDGPLTADIQAKALETKNKIEFLMAQGKSVKKVFADSTYGEVSDFEKEEMLYKLMTINDLLGDVDAKAKTQKRSIALIRNRKLNVERPGEMLMAIGYLKEAGETEHVERMYQALIKKYPETYVYYEKYARWQLKNKKAAEALTLADKAIQHCEGNSPQLYLLKTRILNEMKNKDLALATVNTGLQLPDIDHARFKKTRAQLVTLKEELSKSEKK